MKIMSDNSELTFSNFGIYDLVDQLELILPNTLIKFQRISENAFSYYRKNSEGNVVEKIIPVKSQDVKIELAPIRPLNYPARRTNHILLQFDKEIYLSENSAASIFVNCPIEIGIFLIHNSNYSNCNCSNYYSFVSSYICLRAKRIHALRKSCSWDKMHRECRNFLLG